MLKLAAIVATAGLMAWPNLAPAAQPAEMVEPETAPATPDGESPANAPEVKADAPPSPTESAPPAAAGPTVAYATRSKPPTFIMTTAANGALGMIGAFASIAEGKRIVRAYGLEEPSNVMAAQIAEAFASSKGGRVADAPILVEDEKPDLLAANVAKAQYIIDVQPAGANAIYYSLDWTRYHVLLGTRVRILDGSNGKVIANGKCFINTKKAPESPTYDELMAGNAERLKQEIASVRDACTAELKAKVLTP